MNKSKEINKYYLLMIMFAIGLIIFQFSFINLEDDFKNVQAKVIEVKKYSAIISINNTKYLTNFENGWFNSGDIIQFNGKAVDINNNSYYEFNYQNFLKEKLVFKKIKIDNLKVIDSNSLISKIDTFKNNVGDIYKAIIFKNLENDHPLSIYIKQSNLQHMFNLNGMNVMGFSFIFRKLFRKNKHKFLYLILILQFWFLFIDGNMSFLKIIIIFVIRQNKKVATLPKMVQSYLTFYLLLCFNPMNIYHSSFWYISIGSIFLTSFLFDNKKEHSILKEFVILSLVFLPLNAFYNYNFNIFSEVIEMILSPLLLVFYLATTICLIFLFQAQISPFLEQILVFTLKSINLKSFNYNSGSISLISLIFYYLILYATLKTNNRYSWSIFLAVILIIFIIREVQSLEVSLTSLDVGNANTFIYINKFENKVVIFDAGCGGGINKNILNSYLAYHRINKIDALFISHEHQDHMNLLENLEIKPKQIIRRNDQKGNYEFGSLIVTKFNSTIFKNENDLSMVLFCKMNDKKFIMMGDLERSGEKWLVENVSLWKKEEIDLLQVGHHGSKTSTSEIILKNWNFKNAFISGRYDYKFKFPNVETIKKLDSFNIDWLNTGINGNLKWDLINNKITFKK
ncbi:MBL fold metallo-hydrolase [Mesoplasma photuris]|uniref:MBL fold metallo-hydrolase n=1 Tax=Mesoplasma photuris TaxID=217731 RepID=UPI00146FA337|nr:MBL fold metallo-hydrolase [Mesoplasma photuris]